jgi:hypothetical protein
MSSASFYARLVMDYEPWSSPDPVDGLLVGIVGSGITSS